MTTSSVSIDMSTRAAFREEQPHHLGQALLPVRVAGRWLGSAAGAVTHWLQAGQLGSATSMEMARWSGARR